MSPPIYTPDGSEVSEIVLPDGSTASQVIGPDGNVVFEAGPDIPDSGVSRWTFDNADTESGTTFDSWGNNDGTINGATTVVSGANQTYDTNEAFDFDGSDDYIDCGSSILSTSDANQPYSIAAWINPDSVPAFDIVSQYNSGSVNDGRFIFRVSDESPYPLEWFKGGDLDTDSQRAQGSTAIESGKWQHAVGVKDSNNDVYIYLNGSQDGTETDGDEYAFNGDYNTQIGGRNVSGVYSDGRIDDVRIYDKALTSTEVSNLYQTGSING